MKLEFNFTADAEFERLTAGGVEQALTDFRDEIFPGFALTVANEFLRGREDQPYLLTIDKSQHQYENLTPIRNARFLVRIAMIQQSIEIAVRQFAQILEKTYTSRYARWEGWEKHNVKYKAAISNPQVVVIYSDGTSPGRRISSPNDITSFGPNAYVMITSNNPYQVYMNTKGKAKNSLRIHPLTKDEKNFRGGFYGLAARRIRKQLGINTRRRGAGGTPLWAGALRSREALKFIGMPNGLSPEGQKNWRRLEYLGAWVIRIQFGSAVRRIGG